MFRFKELIKRDKICLVAVKGKHFVFKNTDSKFTFEEWYLDNKPVIGWVNGIDESHIYLSPKFREYQTILLELKSEITLKLDGFILIQKLIGGKYLGYFQDNPDESNKLIVFELESKSILYDLPDFFLLRADTPNILYYQKMRIDDNDVLIAIDKKTGERIWEFDVRDVYKIANSNYNRIYQFIGFYDGCLLLNIGNAGVVAIDEKTGKIAWQVVQLTANRCELSSMPLWTAPTYFSLKKEVHSIKYHLSGDMIFYVFKSHFGSINLKKKEAFIEYDMHDNYAEDVLAGKWQNYRGKVFTFVDGGLFIDDRIIVITRKSGGMGGDYIIAFNVQTQEIDWQYQINDSVFRQRSLQYDSGCLYALDFLDRLHIFERGRNLNQIN